MIAGVVDTGNKFIANDNDTCVQDVLGRLWTRLFMAVRMKPMKPSAAVSYFGGRRYRHF